jgi:5-methylcytosine-specific restriction endonuclease McrA
VQRAHKKYCSQSCRQRAYENRRIVDLVADRDDFDAVEAGAVFARDQWKCGLCGERIDQSLVHPHPFSASLDHVIPRARGGLHVYENVQAAHLTCNTSKKDSM